MFQIREEFNQDISFECLLLEVKLQALHYRISIAEL